MRCDLRESWPNAIDTIRSESRCFMTAAESDASWRGLRSIGYRLSATNKTGLRKHDYPYPYSDHR
jgi:hypothetical protein